MFLGMQGDLIALISESREFLENLGYMEFTEIVETDQPVEMVNGTYYVGDESIISAKQNAVREHRNYLLKTEVDPIVTNPLRWADMSEEEKQQYTDYRRYLLDYTTTENWWEQDPKTFVEWSE